MNSNTLIIKSIANLQNLVIISEAHRIGILADDDDYRNYIQKLMDIPLDPFANFTTSVMEEK